MPSLPARVNQCSQLNWWGRAAHAKQDSGGHDEWALLSLLTLTFYVSSLLQMAEKKPPWRPPDAPPIEKLGNVYHYWCKFCWNICSPSTQGGAWSAVHANSMFVTGKCLAVKSPLQGLSDVPVKCQSRTCGKLLKSLNDVVLIRRLQKSPKNHHIGIKPNTLGGGRLTYANFPWVRLRKTPTSAYNPKLCNNAETSAGKGCFDGDNCSFAHSHEELEHWGGAGMLAAASAAAPHDPENINRRGTLIILGQPGTRMTDTAEVQVRDDESGNVHGPWSAHNRAHVIQYVMGDTRRVVTDFIFNNDGCCMRNVLFDRRQKDGVWLWSRADVQQRDQGDDSGRSGVLIIQGIPGHMPTGNDAAYVEDTATGEKLEFSTEHGQRSVVNYTLGNTS